MLVTVWEDWSGNDASVFSDAAGSVVADVAGPVDLNPGSFYALTLTLNPPIPLSRLAAQGVVVSFQSDTGSGLQSADTLSSLLRYGNGPVALGRNLLVFNYSCRNVGGRTDFNFSPTDATTFQETNEAVAVQHYSTGGTPIS